MGVANAKNLPASDEQDWRDYAAMLYSMMPRAVAAELLAHMRPVFERQRMERCKQQERWLRRVIF